MVYLKSKQHLVPLLIELKESIINKNNKSFSKEEYGVLKYQGRLCVLYVDGFREKIIEEAHGSRYSIHSGSTKMYRDLRDVYWWCEMKREVAKFVSWCPNC